MRKVSVTGTGWIGSAYDGINKGDEVHVAVGPEDARAIVNKATELSSKLPVLEMFKMVKAFIPVAGALPIDPNMVVPLCTAIGGLGGACGAVGTVLGVALAHGYKPRFMFDPGELLNIMDDKLTIILVPPAKEAAKE